MVIGDCAVGIDIGGTRIKSGVVNADGTLAFSRVDSTDPYEEPGSLLDRLFTIVEKISLEAQTLDSGLNIRGIGLALTGGVDPMRGVVRLPGKLKNFEGYPLVPQLAEKTGLPVIADNDGRLAMVAERAFGKAREVDWAVCLTIGTGVGSGVLLGGNVLRDPHHLFGCQVGHFTIEPVGGPLCLTGARGTGEIHCSATALTSSVVSALKRGVPSTLTDSFSESPSNVDFRAIAEAVRNKDPLACDEMDRWTERLGWLIVTSIHAYSPEKVILSGGAVRAADVFLRRLQDHVDRHCFVYPETRRIPIVTSEMTEYSGVLGAAQLIFDSDGGGA